MLLLMLNLNGQSLVESSGGDVMTSIFDVKGSPMYAEFQAVKNKAARSI